MNYFEMANDLYSIKDYKNAIRFYKKSAEIKTNVSASFYNAAVCFIKLKNYAEAISLLKLAIKEKRESNYYFNLGYCYAMVNDNKLALQNFNMAWALNSDDNDCSKAINIILKLSKKNP